MLWESDRAGYRSHGSWGAQSDVYIMFFDAEAYDKFRFSKEEEALFNEMKDNKKEEEKKDEDKDKQKDKKKKKKDDAKENEKKNDKDDDKKDGKDKEVEPLEFDLANRKDRVMRLTVNSSFLGDAVLTPKGDKLYYCASLRRRPRSVGTQPEGAFDQAAHQRRRWRPDAHRQGGEEHLPRLGRTTEENRCRQQLDEEHLLPGRVRLSPGRRACLHLPSCLATGARQVLRPQYPRIDWAGYRKAYERFLPHINNNFDFAEMLSEMLGELNGSHTGARYYAPTSSQATACLGAFYDPAYKGDGLKITEIIAKGPLTQADSKVTVDASSSK